MIERFYLKNYLSFEEIELNLKPGLVVFTGPSGSGKSILMHSILASLGRTSCEASLCESSVTWDIDTDSLGIENEEINIFKHIRRENSRYFVNSHALSKKAIAKVGEKYLRHLSLKDFSDFSNENLLDILDSRVALKSKKIVALKKEYKDTFLSYTNANKELQTIIEEEKKIIELKEFVAFEIKKITDINPSLDEDAELSKIKKELSKKEKVLESLDSAMKIFNSEHSVSAALELLDLDSAFFDDTMNELRAQFDSALERFSALDDIDIEEVLNRVEEISGLKRRYGSIEEAIAYKEQKEIELQKYENIENTKESLEKETNELYIKTQKLASEISELRSGAVGEFENALNSYLRNLYLRDAKVSIEKIDISASGIDKISIMLNNTELSKISTGEFNRLRLAILALKSEFMSKNGGILMLDEIDANLSGEESMSVAKVLRKLSKYFQIFVISHQPQLTSMGDQHFLVYKDGTISKTKELNFNEKVDEIARIISGENVSQEAKKFAQELLEASK